MLKRRKPKPNTVLTYSIIFGLLMAAAAVYEALHQGWIWVAIWAALAIWFFVDAARASNWVKAQREQEAKAKAGQPRP